MTVKKISSQKRKTFNWKLFLLIRLCPKYLNSTQKKCQLKFVTWIPRSEHFETYKYLKSWTLKEKSQDTLRKANQILNNFFHEWELFQFQKYIITKISKSICISSVSVCLKISSAVIQVLNINFDENIDRLNKFGYSEKYFDYFLIFYMD